MENVVRKRKFCWLIWLVKQTNREKQVDSYEKFPVIISNYWYKPALNVNTVNCPVKKRNRATEFS